MKSMDDLPPISPWRRREFDEALRSIIGGVESVKCEHHVCRCARARELMTLADVTGLWRYAREAVEVHEQFVECRIDELTRAPGWDAKGSEVP
jgi:hypothetical protein